MGANLDWRSTKQRSPLGQEGKRMPLTFSLTFAVGTTMRQFQDEIIRRVLAYSGGNRRRAAQLLGINSRTIQRYLGRKGSLG